MASYWACGSPIEAELATSGQKRNADCYPSKPTQAIPRYLADMDALYAERAGSRLDIFYSAMDLTNPIQAMQCDQTEVEQDQSKRTNDMSSSN